MKQPLQRPWLRAKTLAAIVAAALVTIRIGPPSLFCASASRRPVAAGRLAQGVAVSRPRQGPAIKRSASAGSKVQEVNAKDFDDAVRTGAPIVLDVYAQWCGPCKLMEPTLESLAEHLGGSSEDDAPKVLRMDSDANPGKASALGIEGLPTVLFFKGGFEVGRFEGLVTLEELEDFAASAFRLGGTAAAPGGSARASVHPWGAEDVEVTVQTEEALVLGIWAGPQASKAGEDATTMLSSLQLLSRRPDAPRVLIVDASRMPEAVRSLELTALPAVLVFSGGEKLAQLQGPAAANLGMGELGQVVGKFFNMAQTEAYL